MSAAAPVGVPVSIAAAVLGQLHAEHSAHRDGPRGEEETGWLLVGHRDEGRILITAALPAGERREASPTHIRFDPAELAVAFAALRRHDPQLLVLGLLHTHPAGRPLPSRRDYAGDVTWVRHLRGGEGIFGIVTPEPRLWWYRLTAGAPDYATLSLKAIL